MPISSDVRCNALRLRDARSGEVFAMSSPYHGGRATLTALSQDLAQFCLGEYWLNGDIAIMDINIRSGIAEYPLEDRVDMLEMVAEIEAFAQLFGG